MFYTVTGFNFDQDDKYDPMFAELRGTVTIIDDDSSGVASNNDYNRVENGQRLLRATHPSDHAQAQLRDLVYPDYGGVVEDSEEEDEVYDDNED
jgi:hypothetical protein